MACNIQRLVSLGLLVSACGVLSAPSFLEKLGSGAHLDWWQTAVIYQIYPRSFMDSNGDGLGDLRGILDKISYLKHLGVDAVWLSPIYPSPDADFGYDIMDYTNVDPRFGNMYTFLQLADQLEKEGIKLIMDFVPNHSSDKHPWFIMSKNKHQAFIDYYVWRQNVPNNWVSGFGGSAWAFDPTRNAYYLHQFLPEQPDLNYSNPRVLYDMEEVLNFWMSHGVDGFRMDAVYTIWEDDYDKDEPRTCPDRNNYGCLDHVYTADTEGTYRILAKFRSVLNKFSEKKGSHTRIMMTESYSNNRTKILKYYGTKTEPIAHFPFNFDLIIRLNGLSTAEDWSNVINEYQNATKGVGWPNWVLGNHDQKRVTNRFGNEMGDPLNMLGLILKGTMVTYQGEELAMENSEVRWDQAKDPQGIRAGKDHFQDSSRDPQRGPFIWDDKQNAGFTNATEPWLPVQSSYWKDNMKAQNRSVNSHLNIYRRVLKLRPTYILKYGECVVHALSPKNVLAVYRYLEDNPSILLLINMGLTQEDINLIDYRFSLPNSLYVYATSSNIDSKLLGKSVNSTKIDLPPVSSIVLITVPLTTALRVDENTLITPHDYIGLF